ncbi:MAG: sigma 54-interacting transcriptional regulator [Myxococcota bacterium]
MSGSTTVVRKDSRRRRGVAHRLLVLHSPTEGEVGRSHGFEGEGGTIGREGAVIELAADTAVSRRHAELRRSGSGFEVVDLNSSNGVYVNGEGVEQALLHHGDVLRIGDTTMEYQAIASHDFPLLFAPDDAKSSLEGSSLAMRRLRRTIEALAPTAAPVLVLGPSGAGKERVAAELHRLSERKGPLVPVNCAALPEHLVESELFGHAAGAFTGAGGARGGLFGDAEGGTLFLDEIGDMPLSLQPKLLRALATGEVRRVGEGRARPVNVRIVAATLANLEQAVAAGTFRGDLYSRLSAETLRVAPLRERKADIFALAESIVGVSASHIDSDAAEALALYPWPYNVRELIQTVDSVRRSGKGAVQYDDLPARFRPEEGPVSIEAIALPPALQVSREGTPSREDLLEVFDHFDGNVARVAEFFGKARRQIYRWVHQYGIDVESVREKDSGP